MQFFRDNNRNKGGKKPKSDPTTNHVTVNFNSKEYYEFLTKFERSRMTNIVTNLMAMALVCRMEKYVMLLLHITIKCNGVDNGI